MSMAFYPSLMVADQLNLQRVLEQLDPHCEGYQIDVMDGHFVDNLTWGPCVANPVAAATTRRIWLHLMVTDPGDWLERFVLPTGSLVSFHIESHGDKNEIVNRVREKGWHPSVAINPKTAAGEISSLLGAIDQVLVMSVEPGFSGQRFLPDALDKVDTLVRLRNEQGYRFSIGMDGGIGLTNIAEISQRGIDACAVGSAVFKQGDPVIALEQLELATRLR